jgi:hypothetical protein
MTELGWPAVRVRDLTHQTIGLGHHEKNVNSPSLASAAPSEPDPLSGSKVGPRMTGHLRFCAGECSTFGLSSSAAGIMVRRLTGVLTDARVGLVQAIQSLPTMPLKIRFLCSKRNAAWL